MRKERGFIQNAEVETPAPEEPKMDAWILKFLRHLLAEKGASVYTERNYRQALREFSAWFQIQRQNAAGLERPPPG